MSTRRLYYDDAFQKDFRSDIVSCESELHSGTPAWCVILNQTAFYPTSGGQPHDLGKIAGGNVLDVRDEGEDIVHVVDRCVEQRQVECCLNWPRRFDHMQQHSGQHLLSAIFQERFGLQTVSFHLGADVSTIDLRGPQPSEEILEGAERAVNHVIFEDRPVTVRYGTAEDLARLGVRKEVERSGILRAIEIEGVDLQPCGGTHVRSTGQIGILLVRRCTKMRQDWRVEFICGARAARMARLDFVRQRAAAETLGCSPDELISATERALSERDTLFKRTRALLQHLAEFEAQQAVRAATKNSHGALIVHRLLENSEPEYLGFFATEVAKTPHAAAVLGNSTSGHILLAQHPQLGRDMNTIMKAIFASLPGKGGGSRDFARGRLDNPSHAEQALALALQAIPWAKPAS